MKFNEQILHMGLLELSVTLWAFAKAGHASPGTYKAAIPGITRLCAWLPSGSLPVPLWLPGNKHWSCCFSWESQPAPLSCAHVHGSLRRLRRVRWLS